MDGAPGGAGCYDVLKGIHGGGGPHFDAAIDMFELCGRCDDGAVCARMEIEHFPFGAVVLARCLAALGRRDEAQTVCWGAAERAGRIKLPFLQLVLHVEAARAAAPGAKQGQGLLAAVGRALSGVEATPAELAPLFDGVDLQAAATAAATPGGSTRQH